MHQNAFHNVDTYSPIEKQYAMIALILHFHRQGLAAIDQGIETADLFKLPVREEIARAKYLPNEEIEQIIAIQDKINEQVKGLSPVTA